MSDLPVQPDPTSKTERSSQTKDGWDKLKLASGAFAAIAIPVAVALIGNLYTKSIKEREVQSELMKLALQILQQPATEEKKDLRNWATRIIDAYSGVNFTQKERDALIKTISIPGKSPDPQVLKGEYEVGDGENTIALTFSPDTHAYCSIKLWDKNNVATTIATGRALGVSIFSLGKGESLRGKKVIVDITAIPATFGDSQVVRAVQTFSGGKNPSEKTLTATVHQSDAQSVQPVVFHFLTVLQ